MIRKVLFALAGLAVLVPSGLYFWGLALPATSRAERDMRFAASPAQVHARISDVVGQSAWRSDVGRVEISGDGRRWREFPVAGGAMDFHLVESRPAERFAIAYTSSLGFEGRWRAELAPSGNGTRGHFVEEVAIPSPMMRGLARLASPPGQHLDLYLHDLRRVSGP
ncbi:SRPBCC family protein [Sandaracinobacteroides saxicola]|uniref:SRPBCC family protein n=1 Tax=Sandaracinobacteroides saxicola TaxID=2759707 RepID=A0A7G5IDY9_9SPHN|nr:SRPBCC family protein [Sandaracinobacteroides saxicola]QMW21581.1 SRPBCC family protein [Sandaracinobacteroides saxicola]